MTERWHPDERLPVIARFEVRRRAYLAPDGSINRQLLAFASDTRLLVRLYRAMVLVRAFDMKAVALQRTGRLGTYAASLGQEAVSVGTASAMRNDVLLPSYRDNAALIWRGELAVLGRRRAGQLLLRASSGVSVLHSGRIGGPPTLRASPTPSRRERCVYRKLKHGRSGDEVRPAWRASLCHRCAEPGEKLAYPCSRIDAF